MTLENSKGYGLKERVQSLQDVSRSRLNGPTPHQANQRERASLSQVPGGSSRGPRRRARRWTDLLSPDRNMGVPQLMLLLEPNIVWDHTKGYFQNLGKHVESGVSPGEFFEGWHKGGRLARGVYEGSYWELIGDCDEMIEMLKKLARAPPLLEEPTLNLPGSPDLPKWDDFKPQLQALPSAPQMPQLKLPAFRAPLLDTDVPFIEPEYVVVPEVPAAATEEPVPDFAPPQLAILEPFVAPEYVQPEPPAGSEQPHAPVIGKPQHGHDWTGTRPFVVSEPAYGAPKLVDELPFQHPPRGLPKLPLTEDLILGRPDLDLNPIPKVELAWECGPEPEPSYASIPTPAKILSRPGSPMRSRANSRPVSAGPGPPPFQAAAAPYSPALPPPPLPPKRPSSAGLPPPAPAAGPGPAPEPSSGPGSPAALWEEVSDVDAGKPRLWLNFEKPFAELPPLFLPPEPQRGEVNGPEPRPEDFPHDALETEPDFVAPAALPLPVWDPPPVRLPRWVPPCEPRPVGFLRGTAPVLIIDVSGTMNPRLNGKFKETKSVAVELLHPDGELATAAGAFDVIAFCSGAWSWSATYESRMELLAQSQTFYSGRQAGARLQRPTTAGGVEKKSKSGGKLLPTEPDYLMDAANWIEKWPDAVGHTSLLAAFLKADEHWAADCWYIFSDGLADDPQQCTDFLQARIRNGLKCPVIHTVGFFPEGTPENHEGRRFLQFLAEMTAGSFQEYRRGMARVWRDGEGFVSYDLSCEAPWDREEREWAEAQLRAERKKNLALGITERYEVTLARVAKMHQTLRHDVAEAEYEASIAAGREAHEQEVAAVQAHNAAAAKHAEEEHEASVTGTRQRNQARLDVARQAFEEAHAEWERIYEDAMVDWRAQVEVLEAQRAEAIAALNQIRSRPGSAARSRPMSASRPGSRPGSRPTSALRPPPSASSSAAAAASSPGPASGGTTAASSGGASPASHSRPTSRPTSAVRPARPMSARPSGGLPSHASPSKLPIPEEEDVAVAQGADQQDLARDQDQDQDQGSAAVARPRSGAAGAATSSRRAASSDGGASRSDAGDGERWDDEDAGIIEDEAGDEVGDLGEVLSGALDPDEDEELRRQMFPAEVVQALDDENEAALQEIRGEWRKLLKDTDARNKHKLAVIDRNKDVVDKYVSDVLACYAQGFVTDVLHGACVRAAANELATEAARKVHEAACAKVREHNARTAAAHATEVQEKQRKEEQYAQALERWKERKEELARQYEGEIATAKKNHAENIARAEQEWKDRKEEMDAVNEMRLQDAQARHEQLLEDIRQLNLKHRQEFQDKVKAKKAAEAENAARLSEARSAHKVRLELLQQDNADRLAAAQEEHQQLCARLGEEHEAAKIAAQQEYEELRAFLTQHNEALMAEARTKFQEALVQAQHDFDELCNQIRQQHSEELARVRKHNQDIWPQVQVARLAQAELGRVQAFAEHIRFCANKFSVGVNFMPNTPNYDRVVEMQALTEALQKAFPDYPTDREYPWPGHERKGEPGTGWVEAPQPPSLNLKDPAIEIFKLAMGRSSKRGSSAASSRGPSSGAQSPSRPGSPPKTTPRAGSGGPATFLTTEGSGADPLPGSGASAGAWATYTGAGMGAQLPPRPSTASPAGPGGPSGVGAAGGRPGRPSSASGGGLGDTAAAVRRSESTGRHGQRPQSARPPASGYLAGAATQPESPPAVRQLRRPESAGRMRFSNLVAPEAAGGGSGAAGAAAGWLNRSYSAEGPTQSPLAAAAAAAGANRRPTSATARPLSANAQRLHMAGGAGAGGGGPGAAYAQRPASAQQQQQRQRPSSASARPPSANRQQQHLPARVAAKLNGMQSTLSAIRSSPSSAGAGGVGGGTGRPPLAGFTRDLPRLQYAEVDVKALE